MMFTTKTFIAQVFIFEIQTFLGGAILMLFSICLRFIVCLCAMCAYVNKANKPLFVQNKNANQPHIRIIITIVQIMTKA